MTFQITMGINSLKDLPIIFGDTFFDFEGNNSIEIQFIFIGYIGDLFDFSNEDLFITLKTELGYSVYSKNIKALKNKVTVIFPFEDLFLNGSEVFVELWIGSYTDKKKILCCGYFVEN